MNTPYGIQIAQFGNTDVLHYVPLRLPSLAPQEICIKHISIGLNFIDIYHRSGLYPIALPGILGAEAVGEIKELGTQVRNLKVGDIVGYCSAGLGAYTTHHHVAANRVFAIPDSIPASKAAACLLKGLTCEYLIRRCFPVETGQTVLFHAIAGGVGLIACQWLKQLGITVIGTTSTADKADIARANGCDHVIRYDYEDVATRVKEITDGVGVPVVFDGVGQSTFNASLDSLQPRGVLVSFGNASGAVGSITPGTLAAKGSLYLTRPTLGHYVATSQELRTSAADFFAAVDNGLKLHCNTHYALKDAAQAHRDLEARKIIGQAVLLP
ncbi:MAG: quinone oxidoreductase [Alphaproteobacteria bacterium]|nr:quinone oxidoreductase [Alphaproteobacteria bacterium]